MDYLKIDGTFIKDINRYSMDAIMVQSINTTGHQIGLKTIAKFVGNAEVLDTLPEIGMEYVQGYHIDRPRALEQLQSAVFMPR